MYTSEITMALISECGFHPTHEFNRTTFKNMITLHGIHNNIPQLHKTNDGTYLYGNVGLKIHQVDGFKPSYVLTICCMFKPKYCREFRQKNVTLIKVTEFVSVELTKMTIKQTLDKFYQSIR